MTVGMKGSGVKSDVYLESIRLLCLRTQSTLAEALGELQKGSLRTYLKCLVMEIEHQLSSSTTFNMRFSWRLPKGMYPSAVGRHQSLSSMECADRVLPMKALDDLAICEMRAKLRRQLVLQAHPTLAQLEGKRAEASILNSLWDVFKHIVMKRGGTTLFDGPVREKDVVLTAVVNVGGRVSVVLRGRVDLLAFTSFKGTPLVFLFEVTQYSGAASTVKHRLLAYASCIYAEYGFPVIPVLLLLNSSNEVRDAYIMVVKNLIAGVELQKPIRRLVELLLGVREPRHANPEVCVSCDVAIRRSCPFLH